MVLLVLVEWPQWLQQDGAKLLLFAFGVVALLVVARWASKRSESTYEFPPQESAKETSRGVPFPDSELHPRMKVGKYEIRKLYFDSFQPMTGPPDPDSFCGELVVEVEHLETGGISTWGFTVGTPAGFDAKLTSKQWKLMYAPDVFVVRRYDLDQIRAAVIDHITIANEPIPEKASDEAGFTS